MSNKNIRQMGQTEIGDIVKVLNCASGEEETVIVVDTVHEPISEDEMQVCGRLVYNYSSNELEDHPWEEAIELIKK